MKYIDADLLRKEIGKRMHICNGIFERDSDIYFQGKAIAYDETISFLGTISEEPDKSLEEAAEKYCEKVNHRQTTIITDSFKAGAEWQKAQMMKEAVEGQIYGSDGDHWIESEIYENLKGKEGDKVRIIIVNKD